MPTPDCRSRRAKGTLQAFTPWHFLQIARVWRPEGSTVRSACIDPLTARWRRASFPFRCLTTPPRKVRAAGAPVEVRNEVAGIAVDCLGVARVSVGSLRAARDHRVAAPWSAEGQALHVDA